MTVSVRRPRGRGQSRLCAPLNLPLDVIDLPTDWSSTALSAQRGYIVPLKSILFPNSQLSHVLAFSQT